MTRKNENPTGGNKPRLEDWILNDLEKSGLTPEDFPLELLKCEAELIDRLGFAQIGGTSILSVGGYWIPYPNVPGFYRLKLKEKIGDAKYLSPSGKS